MTWENKESDSPEAKCKETIGNIAEIPATSGQTGTNIPNSSFKESSRILGGHWISSSKWYGNWSQVSP